MDGDLKKIILALSFFALLLGLPITSAKAAVGHYRVDAPFVRQPLTQTPTPDGITCSPIATIQNVNFGVGWADTGSPYYLYFTKSAPPTGFCKVGAQATTEFIQYGTSGCVYLDSNFDQTISEGDCNSTRAEWNIITIRTGTYSGDVELQNDYNKACLYQYGIIPKGGKTPAVWAPCNSNNSGDVFYVNW